MNVTVSTAAEVAFLRDVVAALRARAEKAEARNDANLRRIWRSVDDSSLEHMEIWDAVATIRESLTDADADNARLRAALTDIAGDDCACGQWDAPVLCAGCRARKAPENHNALIAHKQEEKP